MASKVSGGIGEIIRKARLDRKLSLRDVSIAIGCNHTSLWRIEQGSFVPTGKRLEAIADFLGLDYDELESNAWSSVVDYTVKRFLKDCEDGSAQKLRKVKILHFRFQG